MGRDFTIRFRKRHWQIPEREADGIAPSAEVVVERRLDGDIRFRFGDRYIEVEPACPDRASSVPRPQPAPPRPPPPKPGPDHPWRPALPRHRPNRPSRPGTSAAREKGYPTETNRPAHTNRPKGGAETRTPGEDISIGALTPDISIAV